MNFDLKERTILLTVAGSRAYGMSVSSSDVDVKGVCIPTKEYMMGFINNFEQADKPSHMMAFYDCLNKEEKLKADNKDFEGSVYGIKKFFKLAADNNPNILDILFCRDEEIRHITSAGVFLRNNRDSFISSKCRWTFAGYAKSQLKRIKLHKGWLLNPVSHMPTRAEFGLKPKTEIPNDQILAAMSNVTKKVDSWEIDFGVMDEGSKLYVLNQIYNNLSEINITSNSKFEAAARSIGYNENFIYMLQKEREYNGALQNWENYNEWKTNRNKERAAMEAKFGFDGKHAAHLVRLYRMCREILETGRVNVYRDDADELLAIRNGAWTYERLMEHVEEQDKDLDKAFINSKLPKKPDLKFLDNLCIELVEEMD